MTAASVATEIRLPARKKNGTDDRQGEHQQKSGFCTPPACCQMNATVMTPSACRPRAPACAESGSGRPAGHGREADMDCPKISSPTVAAAKSMSSPLTNQGSAIAGKC